MINWVIGRNGLLGSSVYKELQLNGSNWQPSVGIKWAANDDAESITRMRESINDATLEFALAQKGMSWNIYWCAGIGVVNSSKEKLHIEVLAVEQLLLALTNSKISIDLNGKVFFASSAGAVYAGSEKPPFTESSTPVAISDYGRQKLKVEDLFTSFGESEKIKVIIGRIGNLYGTKQNQLKQQGLISTLVQNSLLNRFTNIYVPLDTIRNYVYAVDAARSIVSNVAESMEPFHLVNICSDTNHSLSSVLKTAQDVSRRKILYFQSSSDATSLQPTDLRLSTERIPTQWPYTNTSLAVGINNVRLHLLENLRLGKQL